MTEKKIEERDKRKIQTEYIVETVKNSTIIVIDIDDTLLLNLPHRKYNGRVYVDDDVWRRTNAYINYYGNCIMPIGIEQLLKEIKNDKIIYTLTADDSTFAILNKHARLRELKPKIFNEKNMLFVNDSKNKVDILEMLYEKHSIPYENILLIDDKLETLMLADKKDLQHYTQVAY